MEQAVYGARSDCGNTWIKAKSVGGCLHIGREPRDSLLSEYVVRVRDALKRRGRGRREREEEGEEPLRRAALAQWLITLFPSRRIKK